MAYPQPLPQLQSQNTVQQTPGGLYGTIGQPQIPANTPAQMNSVSGQVSTSMPGMGTQAATNRNQWLTNNGPVDTGMDAFNHFADNAYNQGLSRLQPQIDQSNRAMQSQLVARGLEPGTAAYNAAMSQQGRTNNDMLNALNASAQQQGLAAQGQHFGQSMQNNQYDLAQNQQNYGQGFGYDQLMNQRTIAAMGQAGQMGAANINANSANYRAGLNHLLGLDQLASNDRQFDINNITQSQGMDQNFMLGLLGAQNQSQQTGINEFLAQQGANNNWFGQGVGLVGQAPQPQFAPTSGLAQGTMQAGNNMAGAAASQNQAMSQLLGGAMQFIPGMPSDMRLKENIEYIDTVDGVDVFEWDYINKDLGQYRYKGVIAQLVEKTHPHAVKLVNGFKHVLYDLLPVDMRVAL